MKPKKNTPMTLREKIDGKFFLPRREKNEFKRENILVMVLVAAAIAFVAAYASSAQFLSVRKAVLWYYFLVCGAIPLLWMKFEGHKPKELGITLSHWHAEPVRTDVLITGLLSLMFAATVWRFGLNLSMSEVLGMRGSIAASIAFAVLINAPMEEIFWRGFILRNLERVFRPMPALLFHSLLFAGYHIGWSFFRDPVILALIFLASLIFGYLYQKTGSLLEPWIVHCIINVFGVIGIMGIHL